MGKYQRAGLVLAANRRKELPGKQTTKQVITSLKISPSKQLEG